MRGIQSYHMAKNDCEEHGTRRCILEGTLSPVWWEVNKSTKISHPEYSSVSRSTLKRLQIHCAITFGARSPVPGFETRLCSDCQSAYWTALKFSVTTPSQSLSSSVAQDLPLAELNIKLSHTHTHTHTQTHARAQTTHADTHTHTHTHTHTERFVSIKPQYWLGAVAELFKATASQDGRFRVRFQVWSLGNFQVAYSFCPHLSSPQVRSFVKELVSLGVKSPSQS